MLKKIINLACLLLCAGAAFAQDSLSAREAVFAALENNFDILVAEKQIDIAEKNNAWSEAGLFPTVTLQVGQNNTITDNSKNPFTFTPGVILSQGVSPTLSANINIFSGFAVRMSKLRLEQLEEQSRGNAIVVIESTIQDVLRAYFSALLQKERMQLYQKLMGYSQRRLRYNEIKNDYSASNSLELLQFKNQYLTDSTNYILQKLSYENSLRNLVLLMNNTEDTTFSTLPVLSDSLNILLPEFDQDAAMQQMFVNNQNLKNQFIALELQKTAIDYQRSFLYPTLGLQLGVSPQYSAVRSLSGADINVNTQSLSYFGNFTLRYNIYNNWKSKRAVEVAKIQEQITELNTAKLKNSLTVNLANQLSLFGIRQSLVNVSEENLVYATRAFELAQKRFDLGTINSLDLVTFQTNYQNTLIQYYENLYNRMDVFLDIYRSTGNMRLEYVQP